MYEFKFLNVIVLKILLILFHPQAKKQPKRERERERKRERKRERER